jgi:LuxR family maltose regulon positive regulatory protein
VLREWNDLEQALHHANSALVILKQSDISSLVTLGYLEIARVRQAEGSLEQSLDLLHEARALVQQHAADRSQAWSLALLGAYEAQLWLAQGNVEQAVRWSRDAGSAPMPARPLLPILAVYEQDHLMLAPLQVSLAQARTSRDRGSIYSCLGRPQWCCTESEHMGALWLRVKMLILEALAFESLDDRGQALATLAQAVTLAESEGYVRAFADEGASLDGLLRALAEGQEQNTYIGRLPAALPQT